MSEGEQSPLVGGRQALTRLLDLVERQHDGGKLGTGEATAAARDLGEVSHLFNIMVAVGQEEREISGCLWARVVRAGFAAKA